MLHHRPGAEYNPHFDYFDASEPGSANILKKGGLRVGTLLIYLNTPEQCGCTTFPDAGLEVAPQRPSAVFFSYNLAHAAPGPCTEALQSSPAKSGSPRSGCVSVGTSAWSRWRCRGHVDVGFFDCSRWAAKAGSPSHFWACVFSAETSLRPISSISVTTRLR